MSNAVHEAVAGVVSDMLNDTTPAVVEDLSGNNPARVVTAGTIFPTDKVPEQPQPEQSADAPAPPATEPEFPSYAANLEGLDIDLDEPDFDEEFPDDEPTFTAPPVEQESEYEDPEVSRLKRELAKTNARLQWQEQQRVKSEQKNWRAEAGRRFPLCDPDTLQGQSRRAVLRQGKEQHDRFERKIKPFTDALEGIKAQVAAEVRQESREQAQQSWGRPVTGPTVPMVDASAAAEAIDPRNYKNLHSLVLAKMRRGEYGPI